MKVTDEMVQTAIHVYAASVMRGNAMKAALQAVFDDIDNQQAAEILDILGEPDQPLTQQAGETFIIREAGSFSKKKLDKDGWIKHTGNICPIIEDDCYVEVKFSDGSTMIDNEPSGWLWNNIIVAYRIFDLVLRTEKNDVV